MARHDFIFFVMKLQLHLGKTLNLERHPAPFPIHPFPPSGGRALCWELISAGGKSV
jgi:hypothetical protein